MIPSPDNERLLMEVLAEGSDPRLREALLAQSLQLVRRQRKFRQARRVTSVMAGFIGLLLLVSRFVPLAPNGSPPSAKPYNLVRSQPLPANALVQTTPHFLPDFISSKKQVAIVVTSSTVHGFRDLDDDQLLELAAPSSVVLVRHGPHEAQLVFVDQEQRDTILRN
jgi:hypothetical protein